MVCLFGTGRNVLPSPMVARKSFTSNLCINLPLLLEKPKCFQDGAILRKRKDIQFWTLRNLFGHWGGWSQAVAVRCSGSLRECRMWYRHAYATQGDDPPLRASPR